MRQMSEATSKITHDTVALTTKAVHLSKRYGTKRSDGSLRLNMTHKAFGLAFEHIGALREAVDISAGAFDRLRFHVSPQFVTIMYR